MTRSMGGAGADHLDGGAGVNLVSYANAQAAVVVDLGNNANNKGDAAGDVISSVQNVIGSEHNDRLAGDAHDNVLDGGAGVDSLAGGGGNDTYIVDNTKDVVTEAANAGTDEVHSSVSYTLSANVENLTLTGSVGLVGTGNELNNMLIGGDGDDTLVGGLGQDTLTGGGRHDVFLFTKVMDSLPGSEDLITDWHTGDKVDLSSIDANAHLAGDQAFVLVTAFSGMAGEAMLTFDASSGQTSLSLDLDGDKIADSSIKILGGTVDPSAILL